jgi:hypothetical protein
LKFEKKDFVAHPWKKGEFTVHKGGGAAKWE